MSKTHVTSVRSRIAYGGVIVLIGLAALAPPAVAADGSSVGGAPQARVAEYQAKVRPLLAQYCFGCHGEDAQEAGVRLDILDPDTVHGADAERWDAALDMLNMGEMPPGDEQQPSDSERRLIVEWLTHAIDAARQHRQSHSSSPFRRLTREQYTHSLAELLGLPIDFGKNLPGEAKSEMGFTNSSEALFTSPLHAEYFQSIAREALDKAIVTGGPPKTHRYRVRLGLNVGRGGRAAEIGGYQSDPIPREHLLVQILDEQGNPRVARNPEEAEELRWLEENIGVGMRGSSSDRYRITDDGIVLFSAVPHKEEAPKSWQGPSPNLKLLLRRCFPSSGPFVARVVAARAREADCRPAEGLITLRSPDTLTHLQADGNALDLAPGAIVLKAADCTTHDGLSLNGDSLLPDDVTSPSSARFDFKVAKRGYYQIDLVHPFSSAEAMPSVSLRIDDSAQHLRVKQVADGLVVTPLSHAQLDPGEHELEVGGKFFVGFREVVITPLPEGHPIRDSILLDDRDREASEARNGSLRAFLGNRTDDGMEYAEYDAPQVVDAPPYRPATYEFRGRLENLPIPIIDEIETGDLSNIMIVGVWNDHLVKDPSDYGAPVVVRSIEFEAPHYPVWPPESHTQIFFESPLRDSDLEAYTRQVLARFMKRAFRREVQDAEVDRYHDFWLASRGDEQGYCDSVKDTLVAVLCSPHFLYYTPAGAAGGQDTAFAERLAYFLWNSPPDERLSRLAEQAELRDQLAEEVGRMIADPRIERFVRSFTTEWLRLDRHDSMNVNVDLYADYTRFVKRDMALETRCFVRHVLQENLSALTLIDSDFAMLNQNLAEFYGIHGVEGSHFRPVPVTPEMHRGGLLSQGAFLCGHSDGSQAHPIKRAVWLKEKILGSPPPPPPPNVPQLDPETPGFEKLTLKEQLELHRNKSSCVDCHRKIDPYGVVFENYDAVGRFQTKAKGRPIDSTSELPDGSVINGVEELKSYLLGSQRESFVRSFVSHLFAYALGRDVSYADEPEISAIVAAVIEDDYRVQTAILEIARSPSFSGTHEQPPPAGQGGEPR